MGRVRSVSALLIAALGLSRAVFGSVPTLPGDCNLDWSVDWVDFAGIATALSGPGVSVGEEDACRDLDADGDVDLADVAAFQHAFTGTQFLSVSIEADADDGTEVDGRVWDADGYAGSGQNRMGAASGESYDIGLRVHVPQVRQGETFAYARLVVPATDEGLVESVANLRIVGVDQDSPVGFDVVRPSQLPKTASAVSWKLGSNWPAGAGDNECVPLYRYSPDISLIVNEIVAREGWGTGADGKVLAIVIEDAVSSERNFLAIHDYYETSNPLCLGGIVAPALELYRTVRSTFVGKELLGRPTDHSVSVNAFSLARVNVYFEYGTVPGVYDEQTPTTACFGGSPVEAVMDQLLPGTRYYYRMRYRKPGEPVFAAGPERTFHTQRWPGEEFTFTVQSDSHLQERMQERDEAGLTLYRRTLRNALADHPDFHLALGDTFHCNFYGGRDALDSEEAVKRHLDQRPYLDMVCHSAAFFFAIGNHEGELGWRLDGTPENIAVWATNARKLIYPLPVPDGFYTGNEDDVEYVGLRESYYAWEWGDALFVVLDPYWYTTTKPHPWGPGGAGSGDNWDWTLGQEQYDWFRDTLQTSAATFKFVFSHQVTGGVDTYGRGGVEAASHELGGCGSFEWGGEDLSGDDVFDVMRPAWGAPIHDVMVDSGVTVFFHGHDHVFVKQELDGVVYQECPQASDASYGEGQYIQGLYYLSGDKVNNSGHLRVGVSPWQVTVEYVRAYLASDGENGEVAYSYTIAAPCGP